jgi:hypothetical protein
MSRSIHSFSQDYRKKVFDVWYLNGRPDATKLRKLIPPTEEGKTPSVPVLRKWPIEGMWDIYADEMDSKVAVITDADLINKKAEMLRKHQDDAIKVASKALEYIIQEGFDTSAAAVNAYFRSTEEQRKTAGFSDLLEKLEKMTNNQVEQEIIALLNRAADNDQIVDAESEDVGEEKEDSA